MKKQSLNNLNKLLLLFATGTLGMDNSPLKTEKEAKTAGLDTKIYNFKSVFPIGIEIISCNKKDLSVLESKSAEEINKNANNIFSSSVEYNVNQNTLQGITSNQSKHGNFGIKAKEQEVSFVYPMYLNLLYFPSTQEKEWKFERDIIPVEIEENLNHYLTSGKVNRLQTFMNFLTKLSESGKSIEFSGNEESLLNFGEFFSCINEAKLANLSLKVKINSENEKIANSLLENVMKIYNSNAANGGQKDKKEKEASSLNIIFDETMYYTEEVAGAINTNKNNNIISIGHTDLTKLLISVTNSFKLNNITLSTKEDKKEKIKIPSVFFDLSKVDYNSKNPIFNIKNFSATIVPALVNIDISNSILGIGPIKYMDLPTILTSISSWSDKSRPKFISLVTGLDGLNIKNSDVVKQIWTFITNVKNKDTTIFFRICGDSNNVRNIYHILADTYKEQAESSSPTNKKEKEKKPLEVANTYVIAESEYTQNESDKEIYLISSSRAQEINNEEIAISQTGKITYETEHYQNIFYLEK